MSETLDTEVLDRGDDLDIDPDDPDGVLAAQTPPEPEAVPEPEVKPTADPKKPDSRIPLARHKEILDKERAQRAVLEQKLAQYQQGQQVATVNDNITAIEDHVMKLEKEYTRLLADGELDKASVMMRDIRAAERQINEAKGDMKIAAAVAQATESARYNVVLERIEAAFPELNPDSDEYNDKIMARVIKLHAANQQAGMPPAASLQDAVQFVLGEPETKTQERAVTTTPRVSKEDVAAERRKLAVGKALDVTKRTPPSTARVGMDSDKMGTLTPTDVLKMSQDDFKKLPEDVLSRMRGDTL